MLLVCFITYQYNYYLGAIFKGIWMIQHVETLRNDIEQAWEKRQDITPESDASIRDAVMTAMDHLDQGELCIVEKSGSDWKVNEWLKKAILLYFRLSPMRLMSGGIDQASWWDKVPSKFDSWGEEEFKKAAFRAVPNCTVRYSAFIDRDVVLMPSFVNVGAFVGESTMVDTWATIGSCARIGKNCHISGGTGIGCVLEPLQASPVIIEDDVFIGARSEIAEGVIVEQGAVIGMGVFIGASTKIIDRDSGQIIRGRVPAYSVVVPGTLPGKALPDGSPGPNLGCAVIVKKVDEKTRAKTGVNDLLRT